MAKEILKKGMFFIIALFFISCGGSSNPKITTVVCKNSPIYTLYGKKDRRLDAYLVATYLSSNLNSKECRTKHLQTGRDRPISLSRGIAIKDGRYRVDFPIFIKNREDQENCKYKFISLKLIMKRKRDKKLSSIHDILLDSNESRPTYYRTESGSGGSESKGMPNLFTNKKYFQIADNTNYFCRTTFYEYRNGCSFYCLMKIRDGKGKNKFYRNPKRLSMATNPQFGVDEIKDTKLRVNIIADDNNSKAVLYKYRGKDAYNEYGRRRKAKIRVSYPFVEVPKIKTKAMKDREKWEKFLKKLKNILK